MDGAGVRRSPRRVSLAARPRDGRGSVERRGGARAAIGRRSARATAGTATEVHGNAVRPRPLNGVIVPEYDVLDGRFRFRVGTYRDRNAGLSQKLPWCLRSGASAGPWLRLTGSRMGARPRTFSQISQSTDGALPMAGPCSPRSLPLQPREAGVCDSLFSRATAHLRSEPTAATGSDVGAGAVAPMSCISHVVRSRQLPARASPVVRLCRAGADGITYQQVLGAGSLRKRAAM
jgi:hypothetical protein